MNEAAQRLYNHLRTADLPCFDLFDVCHCIAAEQWQFSPTYYDGVSRSEWEYHNLAKELGLESTTAYNLFFPTSRELIGEGCYDTQYAAERLRFACDENRIIDYPEYVRRKNENNSSRPSDVS